MSTSGSGQAASLRIGHEPPDVANLSWLGAGDTWEHIRTLVYHQGLGVREHGPRRVTLPWASFIGMIPEIRRLRAVHYFDIEYSASARERLQEAVNRREAFRSAENRPSVAQDELINVLRRQGFLRELSPFQLRNVSRIAALPAAATFSVPGAGKTTEALAYFFARRTLGDRLLVIAPKNAFGAWDEQLAECAPGEPPFVRLVGGASRIEALLDEAPRYAIITYQQVAQPHVPELLGRYLDREPYFVFLDESHRIKAGRTRITAQAILDLSHLPRGKLIMSGTPMPQAEDDLEPQFSFLYPEVRLTGHSPVELIQPIYVRTTKDELGLRAVDRRLVRLPMRPLQGRLYELIRSEAARRAAGLNLRTRSSISDLGRGVVRLLQFVSNPSLIAAKLGETDPELLAAVLGEGDSPKISWACSRARELARHGRKVIIWSSWVQNVELIANRLFDLGADFIHGGVGAGEEDDDTTREGKIRRFHDDPQAMVLVANPAAAGEGISLHRVCHHAVYVDRTFNASHYLQSEDRIHRFGLPPDQETVVEVLECIGTIDEVVQLRLNTKVERMAEALNDHSIRIDPVPYDAQFGDEPDAGALSADDVEAIIKHLNNA